MDKKVLEQYQNAGKIWKQVAKKARKACTVDAKLLDIAGSIEKSVARIAAEKEIKGAGIAFPVNLSRNNEAAHATPRRNDESVLKNSDVLKVDIGVHVNGFIADGAFTVNLSNDYAKMIDAAEQALENALARVKPGCELLKIGKTIEDTIVRAGFKPIQNLSGHGLEQFEGHAPPTIPNIDNNDERILEENMAFAIEPFASTGEGSVHEGAQQEIFCVDKNRAVRNQHARKLLEFIAREYGELYFAERWLDAANMNDFQRKIGLRELLKNSCIKAAPVLKEAEGTIITQAEKTVVICEGEVYIIN